MNKYRHESTQALVRAAFAQAARAYREAIAAQLEGRDSSALWGVWEADTAAMLLGAWATGARNTLQMGGVPVDAQREALGDDAPGGPLPPRQRFARKDAEADSLLVAFEPGPAREVVVRFMDTVPMTRSQWDRLITLAFQAAKEMADGEAASALRRIVAQSPDLEKLVFPIKVKGGVAPEIPGVVAPTIDPRPTQADLQRSPGARRVAQGGFFVTGMTVEQVKTTRSLLAQALRGDISHSVAGKELKRLGIGDFVEQTILRTGVDLTAARLETVYRTNYNRAQSQGRLDICRNEEVQAFVPLLTLRATRDSSTRPTHSKMAGYVATVDMIDRMGILTPLGFNCRCSWVPVPIATAVANGWCSAEGVVDFAALARHNESRQELIDLGQVPDPGFISG